MPYKQIFSQMYPNVSLRDQRLSDLLVPRPDGRLILGRQAIDLGVALVAASHIVLTGDQPTYEAQSPDGHYHVSVEAFPLAEVIEFWLVHTDRTNGNHKRVKLSTDFHPSAQVGTQSGEGADRIKPQVSIAPDGSFFLVNDGGIVRLYSVAQLADMGAFQLAHGAAENHIVALAVSSDGQLVAGLSSWKDIVLYHVADHHVHFVRQIKDTASWYDYPVGHIILTPNTETIVTVGLNQGTNGMVNMFVNAFRVLISSRV